MGYDYIISGDIDEETFKDFAEYLTQFSDITEVKVLLISDGGDAHTAMAFYDLITKSPAYVTITATGKVFSAATLILAAADTRYMTKNTYLMFHEDSISGLEDVQVAKLEKEAKHARRMEDHWNRLMAERTNISEERWSKIHKKEVYIDAEQCLKLKIIHGIV